VDGCDAEDDAVLRQAPQGLMSRFRVAYIYDGGPGPAACDRDGDRVDAEVPGRL